MKRARTIQMQGGLQPMVVVPGRTFAGRRPVDKAIIVVAKPTLSNSQASTDLVTATFPCTVVGLRWSFTAQDAGNSDNGIFWAIVILRDGETADTLTTSDAGTLYNPEQNVLTWGVSSVLAQNTTTGPAQVRWDGDTKTMRKLMGGDKLVFIAITTAAANVNLRGCVQFFCKT